MRKLILTGVAACLIIGCAAFVYAVEYNPGIICVEFGDNVNLERNPGTKGSGHPSLDALAEKYDVYEAEAVFPIPKGPIKHPHGLWDWEDWQRSAAEARLKYVYVLRFRANADPRIVAEDYKKDPYVLDAAAEARGKSYMFPNDPDFEEQWYLYNESNRDCDIHWPEGWDRFIFVPPEPRDGYPIAGVIDTGIYASDPPNYGSVHQDIVANIGPGYDAFETGFPLDISGHGTSVTGIIAAETGNWLGIAGVGVNAVKVMPVRTHYYDPIDPYIEARGMFRAVNMGADLLNMSWGGGYSPAVRSALEHAWDLDVVTVAASGNNSVGGGEFYSYPAVDGDARMISVGGTVRVPTGWQRWTFSGWWNWTVDVVAPASPDIYTTWLNHGYANKEGTSYSCPMVAGIAGGCLAMLEGPYTGIDDDVRDCIHRGGWGWGLLGWPQMETGYGTEYYERALDRAIAIKDGSGDGGPGGLAAAAPFVRLAQNAPNPASSSTTFRLDLSVKGTSRAELAIYDLSGRKVRTFDVPVKDGSAELAWDLTASDGSRVAPGVYIYRVTAGGVTAAKKCVIH